MFGVEIIRVAQLNFLLHHDKFDNYLWIHTLQCIHVCRLCLIFFKVKIIVLFLATLKLLIIKRKGIVNVMCYSGTSSFTADTILGTN